MNYFFLFLLLSFLQHVFCNSEEQHWQDLKEMTVMENMERKETEQAPRAPKAVSDQVGCIPMDAPPLQHSSKSHHHTICNDEACIATHMELNHTTGISKVVGTPGGSYKGTVNTTVSGRTCKVWNTLADQYADYARFGAHNYCRGNISDPSFVFCFTTDPYKEYEECDIRRCLALTKGER